MNRHRPPLLAEDAHRVADRAAGEAVPLLRSPRSSLTRWRPI
ncbi:hypothetical protein [Streptosporangium roseum]